MSLRQFWSCSPYCDLNAAAAAAAAAHCHIAALLQAQQLWDALQSAQEALQRSDQLHELRTAALRALLKRQSRMAVQPEAQALQWAVLAAWQRQTARQVRVQCLVVNVKQSSMVWSLIPICWCG
jgi:hypothetical protein